MALADTQLENTNSGIKKFLPLIIKLGLGVAVIAAIISGIFFAINTLAPEVDVNGDVWVPDYSIVVGDRDAEVKMVVFEDLQCPACKDNQPKLKNLKENYSDRVGFVYRHLPLRSIHPFAQTAAEGAVAAAEQGDEVFLAYLDEVYAIQNDLSNSALEEAARNAGADIDEWTRDKNSSFAASQVNADEEFITTQTLPESPIGGSTQATGTPSIVILKNDEPVSWWSGSQDEAFQESELLKYLGEDLVTEEISIDENTTEVTIGEDINQ